MRTVSTLSKHLTLVAVLVSLVAAGCGSNEERPAEPERQGAASPTRELEASLRPESQETPPTRKLAVDESATGARGYPGVPVETKAEADALCERVQARWPAELGDATQVQFDLPDAGADLTCMEAS